MKKVSIVGAGNVGGACAMRIAESGLARVVLIDVAANLACAKVSDLEDAQYSLGREFCLESSGEMSLLSDSNIVVVTAGLARKPGMTREDLLSKNAQIMQSVCEGIKQYAEDAIVIVVSNPLDVMTYLAFKKLGFPRERVFGMGASLDSARFANLISKKLFTSTDFIKALVVGSHGETMLPLPRLTLVRHKLLTSLLNPEEVLDLTERTKKRGAEIVSLYGSGSAYFGPSAAIFDIVSTILSGRTKEIPVSVVLDGEYGLFDVSIGVPVIIDSCGIKQIIELDLTAEEKEAFVRSADSIKDSFNFLKV